ncbi:MAG: hypothetical protein JW917_04650 [Ignavibacteria bacterium]|nr:hypothetical protein [Ignavibacteria bacterium]
MKFGIILKDKSEKSMNYKIKYLPYLLIALFCIFNSGCNLLTDPGSTNAADLIGVWELYKQTGALQDVCPNEILKLSSDGVAKLQCPNQTEIIRNYTAVNGVLTYTQTGVSFDFYVVTKASTPTLELYGKNVSRNLFYNKISSVPTGKGSGSGGFSTNSSENINQ